VEFMARFHGKVPTSNQVGEYLAVHNYLRAVQSAGASDGVVTADKLRARDIDILVKRYMSEPMGG
jgi:hypothetical protein